MNATAMTPAGVLYGLTVQLTTGIYNGHPLALVDGHPYLLIEVDQ